MSVAVILPTLCLLAWPLQASAQQPQPHVNSQLHATDRVELSVQVTDVKHAEGKLLIGVFNQENGFPREIQQALVVAKVEPGKPTHRFKDLPRGNYAVVVIHDRNHNGQLDRNLFGMPQEPVGLSNYPSIGLSNPPTFRKAVFALKTSGLVKVKLNPF